LIIQKSRNIRANLVYPLFLICLVLISLTAYPLLSGTSSVVIVRQQPTLSSPIKEFPIQSANAGPNAIVHAPNGSFWFVEYNIGKIGELSPSSGTIREFNINETGATPASLAIEASGDIWFTDQKIPSVWVFHPSSATFHRYVTNVPNSTPVFVIADPSNRIWFTDTTANYVGNLDPLTGVIVPYHLPTSNSGPAELAVENGTSYLWISESFTNKIARFDAASHSFQEYAPSFSLLSPVGISVDKNGNVWTSEHGGSSIAELIPSNSTFRKYPTSQPTNLKITAPATIALDKFGRIWFVEHFSNKVGRLDPRTGVMNEFVIPTSGLAYSLLNALDSNGNFWFTEYTANRIGMINWNATSPVTIDSILSPIPIIAGHSTSSQIYLANNSSSSIDVQLNFTSTFNQYGQTTNSEISLSNYSLVLSPNQSKTIVATITPDNSLSSGTYAAGIEAIYGNTSVIGIIFLQVQGNFSIIGLIVSILPVIAIGVAAVLLLAGLLIRRRKASSLGLSSSKPPVATVVLALIVIVGLAIPVVPESAAKCIGLPPPPPNQPAQPDYIGIGLDVGALVFFAIVAFLLIRDRMRRKGQGGKS